MTAQKNRHGYYAEGELFNGKKVPLSEVTHSVSAADTMVNMFQKLESSKTEKTYAKIYRAEK